MRHRKRSRQKAFLDGVRSLVFLLFFKLTIAIMFAVPILGVFKWSNNMELNIEPDIFLHELSYQLPYFECSTIRLKTPVAEVLLPKNDSYGASTQSSYSS